MYPGSRINSQTIVLGYFFRLPFYQFPLYFSRAMGSSQYNIFCYGKLLYQPKMLVDHTDACLQSFARRIQPNYLPFHLNDPIIRPV
jgi:hypothetical protein